MEEIICPIDGRPCDPDCDQWYADLPEGGCWITDFVSISWQSGGQRLLVVLLDDEAIHELFEEDEEQLDELRTEMKEN